MKMNLEKKSTIPTFSEWADDLDDLEDEDFEEEADPSASFSASSISVVRTVSIN